MSFRNNTSITSVTIPKPIIILEASCFSGCRNITKIKLPDSINYFMDMCFSGCSSLSEINIPNSVISFGLAVFQNCSSLTNIDIPLSVRSIGDYCFNRCSNLISINLNWESSDSILAYNSEWITYANSNLKFYIPPGTTSLYTAKGYPSDKLVERSE